MDEITKKYGSKIVLNGARISLNDGCSIILGKNGSGKTTFFKVLCGLYKKVIGDIDYKNDVSLLVDSPCLFSFKTGYDNLLYFLNKEEVINALKLVETFSMKEYIKDRVYTYSSGMKKKLSLVICLSKNKSVYILDEPTNSLDIDSIEVLKEYLIEFKRNKKIIIASHELSIFDNRLIDYAYKINNLKIHFIDTKELDFVMYRIKTKLDINNISFKYTNDGNYYYFKINIDDLFLLSKELSPFVILEMSPLSFVDNKFIEAIYD